jgi:hypothetical protein
MRTGSRWRSPPTKGNQRLARAVPGCGRDNPQHEVLPSCRVTHGRATAAQLGISQMQVSRLLVRALARLREELLAGG